MKKQSKSKLNKLRWKELSLKLRTLHPACEYCGKTDSLQVHHITSKYYKKSLLRFEEYNLIVVCGHCHFVFHQSPVETISWLIKNKNEDYKKILEKLGKTE